MLKNPKWEKFCLEYAQSGNAADAYPEGGIYDKKRGDGGVLRAPVVTER